MASIPVVGTRWRSKDTGDVVEVTEVAYSDDTWVVVSRRLADDNGPPRIIAKAHWFTTEGFEPILEDA